MAVKLGLDAKLYVGGTEVENCRNLSLGLEKTEADVSVRGSGGWTAIVGTMKNVTIEWEMVDDSTDAALPVIISAWIDGTDLAISVEDGGTEYGGGSGIQALCEILSISREESLEDAIIYSITAKPTYAPDNNPEWV